MKKYAGKSDMQSEQVKEPLSAYSSSFQGREEKGGISAFLMDELLRQSNDVKLMIIKKLSESMLIGSFVDSSKENQEFARQKEIEAKLDELHVTGNLRHLVDAFPSITDEEMETVKEEYFKEKYGL